MEEGHSDRSFFLLHIPCFWLGKCAATENSYFSVFRKVMKSNQGKTGDRHPDLAEKNLQQKGFYLCSWDNIGNTVWLQLFLEQNFFFFLSLTSLRFLESHHNNKRQRLWSRPCVESKHLLQGHCLTTWPRDTLLLFIFICKNGNPESVTVFFTAQSDSSSMVLCTNATAEIILSSPCNCTFPKWGKIPD